MGEVGLPQLQVPPSVSKSKPHPANARAVSPSMESILSRGAFLLSHACSKDEPTPSQPSVDSDCQTSQLPAS